MDEEGAGYKGTGDVEAGGVEAREGVFGARVEGLEAEELGGGVGDDGASWGVLVGERRGERRGEGMKREEGERGRRRTLIAFVDEEDGDRLRDRVLVRGPLRRLLGWWRRTRLRLTLCKVGLGERRHRHATYAVLLVSRYYIKDNNLGSMSCSTHQSGSTRSIY